MLVAERWQRIVQVVNERGSIRVTELSELCQVTEETIRRDLDRLESEGKLMRSHGGAVSVKEAQTEVPFMERETAQSDFKNSIAKEAITHIREHDRIILDASTTAWYMARWIPDMPLTIITNSMKVALELSTKEKIQVISTGGLLSPKSLSYVGPLAERSLDMYHVHKCFLSCKGVHIQRGISESNELQALIKSKMISIADETYLLADHSKFGMQSLTQVAGWSEIKHVITDGQTSREDVNRIRDIGVNVLQLDKG
ncbi:DeoR family transcriptional regulator [Paenibacillus ferrarius]|uniref:DeoR family transcriptional regulator n=1 Tax=Paenibacillus ferrarius TaxID=1469647 RepID=A0A1V4HGL1_9BACL|nr:MULTISPECIES: DeoR/GlpR family DNA-binding transcription regulator [Paenibacillus]NQX71901.1 DeoR/GlpR transcriptional regulator [Paenibacillus alba]OPH54646.1 DeoR family transcriptional regulator [Paenibacillus ferrarius]